MDEINSQLTNVKSYLTDSYDVHEVQKEDTLLYSIMLTVIPSAVLFLFNSEIITSMRKNVYGDNKIIDLILFFMVTFLIFYISIKYVGKLIKSD